MKRIIVLYLVVFGLLNSGGKCEEGEAKKEKKDHYVSIFLLDSMSSLNKGQKGDQIFSRISHAKIVHKIILENCQPDNLDVFDLDDNKGRLDRKKYFSALEKIIRYADQHRTEKIIVNMSFSGYYHPILDFISEDERITAAVKDELKKRLVEEEGMKDEESVEKTHKEFIERKKNEGIVLSEGILEFLKMDYINRLKAEGLFIDDESITEIIEAELERFKAEGGITEETIRERKRNEELIRELAERGVIMVAAAGNNNIELPAYPAAFPDVIAVAAHNWANKKASYSNYGKYIDICATGNFIYHDLVAKEGGTSFAAPRVTATIAKMFELAKGKDISPLSILQNTARGIDDWYGNKGLLGVGMMDRKKALQKVDPMYGDEHKKSWIEEQEKNAWIGIIVFLILIGLLTKDYIPWPSAQPEETEQPPSPPEPLQAPPPASVPPVTHSPPAPVVRIVTQKEPVTRGISDPSRTGLPKQKTEESTRRLPPPPAIRERKAPPPPPAHGSKMTPAKLPPPFKGIRPSILPLPGTGLPAPSCTPQQIPLKNLMLPNYDFRVFLNTGESEMTVQASRILIEGIKALNELIQIYNGYCIDRKNAEYIKMRADQLNRAFIYYVKSLERVGHQGIYIIKLNEYISTVDFIKTHTI